MAAGVPLRRPRPNNLLRYGVPFLSFMVLSYAAMGHIIQGRKEIEHARDEQEWADITARQALTREGPLAEGAAVRPRLSLEEELERLRERVDINKYENKPVPKPKVQD